MGCGCSTNTQTNNVVPEDIKAKIENHPCYSEGAHHYYARIHVPVAPACNIQCNYCNRKFDCSNESRPGVTSGKLKPLEAVKKVLYVGGEIKQLSVVGIAGPGDALANPKQTFETLALLKEHTPDLKLCISTNGLELENYVDELAKYNVEHITVTINTLDPKIGADIYSWIYDKETKKKIKGEEAAKILIDAQLRGIAKCVEKGLLVKANSVLIPDINDKDLPNVAKKLKELGVFLHNIMPLLSKLEFGTKFSKDGVKSASYKQLEEVQEACGIDMKLMKHCRQCRADAVGLIGEDKSGDFSAIDISKYSIEELQDIYNIEARKESQSKIEQFRKALDEANKRIEKETGETTIKVAVTSAENGLINQHFGSAKEFLVYEAGLKGVKFLQSRKIDIPYGVGVEDESNPIESIKKTLSDVHVLLTAKIGESPKSELSKINLKVDDSFAYEPIKESIMKVTKKFLGANEQEAN